jgi:hypothetical protein
MIIFVTTATHAYTHAAVAESLPMVRRIAYPVLLSRRSLPRATYVFTDFDRLSAWQLEIAAHLYRVLVDAGCRVLNDPARALQRLALIRRLSIRGLNTFTAWPASEAESVDRFPVFLRTAAAHRGVLTDLLETKEALAEALETTLASGLPLSNLIIVQYRATPSPSGVFRKRALFRIGDAVAPDPSVHERHWAAKYGENGAAGAEGYAQDLEEMHSLPFAPAVLSAFQAADIDYGRADYGLVDGRPETYEINTNPMIDRLGWTHPFPDRIAAVELARARYLEAVKALDTTNAGARVKIPVTGPRAMVRRGRGAAPAYLWTP